MHLSKFYICCTDFDEEDVNLTAILSDLSQIEENINLSKDGKNFTYLYYFWMALVLYATVLKYFKLPCLLMKQL